MFVRDLFEDVDQDVQYSRWAHMALQGLKSAVNSGHLQRKMVLGRDIQTGDPHLTAWMPDLIVMFHRGRKHEFFINDLNTPVINLGIGGDAAPFDAEYVARALDDEWVGLAFIHEFVHFLDMWEPEGQNRNIKASPRGSEDPKGYFNDPYERNAYFMQLAEPVLKILRAAKEGDAKALERAGTIEPDFEQYLRWQFRSGAHQAVLLTAYRHLDEVHKKAFLARLHALHRAATAIQGVAAPHRLNAAQGILQWLGRTLKRLGVGKKEAA